MYGRGKGFQKGLGKVFSDILLLMIAEEPSHGYQLTKKLEEFGIQFPSGVGQMGRIYRILADFEELGLVSFEWDTSYSPPRKIYNITEEGKKHLQQSVTWAKNHIDILNIFIDRSQIILR